MAARMDEGQGRRGDRLRLAIWGLAAALFLLPLVAMQFTDEVAWTAFDFVVWGAMLLAACGAWELVRRLSADRSYRAGAGVAIVIGFLTFWVNAAVGMVGDEDNPYNLLFLGTIAVAGLGALLARFRPAGVAAALLAATLLQAGAALFALATGMDPAGALFSAGFALPWLASAALFRRAARRS